MCTVSFIPIANNDFILTSNRDESPHRETLPPKIYEMDQIKMLFPKDTVAGGTWIGASQYHRLICLLNGGFRSHKRKENYRMSRGKIVTDLLSTKNIKERIETYDLSEIEPFTLIIINWERNLELIEMVWTGNERHISEKPIQPTIWSSSLLYSETVKKKRKQWFLDFLDTTDPLSEEKIINFHKYAGEGNIETNLIMDRIFVKTKSITGFTKNNDQCKMRYEDLMDHKTSVHTI